MALWRQRRSGAVTSGRRLCELIVTAKLVKKNYIKEERKRYTSYTEHSVMCRGRCREKCVDILFHSTRRACVIHHGVVRVLDD